MLRHIFTTAHEDRSAASPGSGTCTVLATQDDNTLKSDLDLLHSMSRSGLWGLLIFLAASAIAYYFRSYTLVGILPIDVMAWLGPTPDVLLINIVFGASTVSSLITIAGRIYNGRHPSNTWLHLGFRVFFYLLYFISGSLSEYFNVVFIAGLVVLALQHCNVWNYYSQAIESKQNKFDKLHPCGR